MQITVGPPYNRPMDGERRRGTFRSFLLGGLVGSAAGLAAAGRMKVRRSPARRTTPVGLAAFEQAPCFRELVEEEEAAARR